MIANAIRYRVGNCLRGVAPLVLVMMAPPIRAEVGVDFDTQIIPVLTRAGCNAAACHGSAMGRGNFKLSLFGGDSAADYEAIARQFEGRRINLSHPEQSLLLGKPTGLLEHGGGVRLEEEDADARRIRDWITAGAVRGGGRKLREFEIGPSPAIVERVGSDVRLRATATFTDGTSEDVTSLVVLTATDPSAVEISATEARVTVLRRGQHVVVARYLDRVVPLTFRLPMSDRPADLSRERRANFIDEEILQSLDELRLPVAPAASDAAFVRRVTLDLTGRLPTRGEAEAFAADRAADKRARLVDHLLMSDAFVEYWTHRFATLLRVRTSPNDRRGAQSYYSWLRQQIAERAPLNQVARQLLTATGDTHEVGPANFSRTATDARGQAELVSQVFLGARLACANCHNHPLDRWTQDDYHGLAAIFARLERGRVVSLAARGAVTNLRTGEAAVPRIPGVKYLSPEDDCRDELAEWITNPDNKFFSRAIVNRLWRWMFGRGLVEPVDDLRSTNPATHPELLDRLAVDFVEHGYDLRHTLRRIAASEAYGRGDGISTPPAGEGNRALIAVDDRFYTRAYSRPLEAEVLADAIADVTGVADRYGDEPLGTRAIALFDPATPAESLDVLGRCSRLESCEASATGGGLPAKLHQLNGPLVNRKIAAPEGRLRQRIAAGASDDEIVAEFYIRALGRSPDERERTFWRDQLTKAGAAGRVACLEDFVWSLLTCSEFASNH